MDQKLLDGLFKSPYDHKRWLADQQTLIDRMKKKRSKFMKEQRAILEDFQKGNQCSSIMIDIMKERLEKKLDKTNESVL